MRDWLNGVCIGMIIGPVVLATVLYYTGHMKVFGQGSFGLGRLFCIY